MSERINTAFRVNQILQKAVDQHDNQTLAQMWVKVFRINETGETRRNFEISRCLNQLYGEVEVLERLMDETDLTKPLYLPYLEKIRSCIDPSIISAHWSGYKPLLSPDTLLSLKFCIEILPAEELGIDPADIEEIEELTISLEKILEESNLPFNLKYIIGNHIIKIREALYSYQIIGSKAMVEVVKSAYGEVIENQVVFEAAKDTEPIYVLSRVWQKIKDVADGAKTVNEGATAGIDLAEKGVRLLSFVEKILSSSV